MTFEELQKLRETRATEINEARRILDKADEEKRSLTAEENEQYDKIMSSVDEAGARIAKEERMAKLEKELTAPTGRTVVTPVDGDKRSVKDMEGAMFYDKPEYRSAFLTAIRTGNSKEVRSLIVGNAPKGGFFVPTTVEKTIRAILENENVMRRLCNVQSSNSDVEYPFEEDYGQAYWAGEEEEATESDIEFSKGMIQSHKLMTLIKVSDEMLSDSSYPIESHIGKAFGRRYARKEEPSFIKGDGSGKPRGFILDSAVGVTTGSTTAITADELIDLYHSLPRYHRSGAVWLMSDLTAKLIRKLKNATTGDYMWQPGLKAGQPDMLLGKVVEISDDMDEATAALKPIAFGDFKEYTIMDRMNATLQRLIEKYATSGQVGFLGKKRVDGKLMRKSAIKVLQMKA